MCSDCEAYELKKHGLTRSDYRPIGLFDIIYYIPDFCPLGPTMSFGQRHEENARISVS